MFSDVIMLILEIVGSISFAVSGAFVGIRARLDIFGVVFVSVITAFGGGILRDILMGSFPPSVFGNPAMFSIAVLSAIVVFVISYMNRSEFSRFVEKTEYINNFFDAIGLAAFSVMGTERAFAAGFDDNMSFTVTLGMLTGIGGGIFRDVLTDSTPFVFKKHIYAIASICGSILYFIMRTNLDGIIIPSVISMFLVFIIRMLATKYRWSLPKIKIEDAEGANK